MCDLYENIHIPDEGPRGVSGLVPNKTWWKKLLHKFFSWTLNLLLFLRMSYFKRMHISKKRFSRFFLCSGMKLELITIICTLFGQTEIIDLFAGLFGFKSLRLPHCFSMCLDTDKKILPLC